MNGKREFSKTLLIQESALIWVTTIAYIILAFYCIKFQYLGTLPWLTAGVSLPWVAYGVSQGFYYNKSKKENSKDGIKYELALREVEALMSAPAIAYDEGMVPPTQNNEETREQAADAPIDLFGPV